jgi:hypothetical protein
LTAVSTAWRQSAWSVQRAEDLCQHDPARSLHPDVGQRLRDGADAAGRAEQTRVCGLDHCPSQHLIGADQAFHLLEAGVFVGSDHERAQRHGGKHRQALHGGEQVLQADGNQRAERSGHGGIVKSLLGQPVHFIHDLFQCGGLKGQELDALGHGFGHAQDGRRAPARRVVRVSKGVQDGGGSRRQSAAGGSRGRGACARSQFRVMAQRGFLQRRQLGRGQAEAPGQLAGQHGDAAAVSVPWAGAHTRTRRWLHLHAPLIGCGASNLSGPGLPYSLSL